MCIGAGYLVAVLGLALTLSAAACADDSGAVPAAPMSVATDLMLSEDHNGTELWSLRADRAVVERGKASLDGVHARFPGGLSVIASAAAAIGALHLAAPAASAATPGPAKAAAAPVAVHSAAPAAASTRPATRPASRPVLTGEVPMEIAADRLEVDHRGRRARFAGNVIAVRGDMKLRCDRIDASYDVGGVLRSVEASGAVVLETARLRATADGARYLEDERVVELHGALEITDGSSTVRGASARVYIDEERFVVERARGRLMLGRGAFATATPVPGTRRPKPAPAAGSSKRRPAGPRPKPVAAGKSGGVRP